MILITDLIDNTLNAVQAKASFQSLVRGFISENTHRPASDIARDLSKFVTEFRYQIEPWIQEVDTTSRRKDVNNVINDVARISREQLQYTIICVSRKPVHTYETRKVNMTPKEEPVPFEYDSSGDVKDINRDILNKLRGNVAVAIDWLLDNGHPIEDIARVVVNKLKEAKTPEAEMPF